MKRISNYLKMRVLGALEYAAGDSLEVRYKAVSQMTFVDEDGVPQRFTWRTIQTWWWWYRHHGVTEPASRTDKGSVRKVEPERLLEAIEQVMPSFHGKKYNIAEIYRACIERGHLRRETVAPNTFRRHVNRFQLLKPVSDATPKRRLAFAKAHANDLWQTDTLHGPFIRIGGTPTRTFLICFIDDASRVVPHGQFYPADTTHHLIDCLQTALHKRGVPKAIYADNGSNYSSGEFATICSRLGVVLIHTPVRDGAAKGKIERFFRTVREQFLVRDLGTITSLRELNENFNRWLEETYHERVHSTLGMKPIDRFGLDLQLVRRIHDSEYNHELFHLQTTRKVRADNTFLYNNTRYEAPRDLRGKTLSLRHDRLHPLQPPVAYLDDICLGPAVPLDPVANDRRPNL